MIELLQLITDPGRKASVIVVSLPEDSECISDSGIDLSLLCRRTLGAAHVVAITGAAAFELAQQVGKEFSVFQRSVRTYRPGFNQEQDEPFRHPLGLWQKIQNWEPQGPSGYLTFLVDKSLAGTVFNKNREEELPSFSKLKRLEADAIMTTAQASDSSINELLALFENENSKLKSEIEELTEYFDGELNAASNDKEQLATQNDYLSYTNSKLQERISKLHKLLQEAGGGSTPIPDSLENFEDWCTSYLSGSVEVHGRALRSIKDSGYHDTSLIYKSLIMLRDLYVPLKTQGGEDLQSRYAEEVQTLGLQETPSFSGPRLGEQGIHTRLNIVVGLES